MEIANIVPIVAGSITVALLIVVVILLNKTYTIVRRDKEKKG